MAEKFPDQLTDDLDEPNDFSLTVNSSISGRLSFASGLLYGDSDDEDWEKTNWDCNDISPDSIVRGHTFCDVARTLKEITIAIIGVETVCNSGEKFVQYIVSVVRSPGLDTDSAIVRRRYSRFYYLHAELCKTHRDVLEKLQVKFPRKKALLRFSKSVIEERKRLLEAYLMQISRSEVIRKTEAFREFFYLEDLREACSCLREGNYMDSYKLLLNGLHLQEKLGLHLPEEIAATLCSIVVACMSMEKLEEAEKYAYVALEILEKKFGSVYHLPLLNALIEVLWRSGKDKADLERRLTEVQRLCKRDVENASSLRELAVGRFS